MTRLAFVPQTRIVNPQTYSALRDFTCGGSGHGDRRADDLVRGLCAGELPEATVMVAVHPHERRVMGLSAHVPRAVSEFGQEVASAVFADAWELVVIKVSEEYRQCELPESTGDEPISVGDLLAFGVLQHIEANCDERMPAVWAVVSEEDLDTSLLLERWGFMSLGSSDSVVGEQLYVRFPEWQLSVTGLDWS